MFLVYLLATSAALFDSIQGTGKYSIPQILLTLILRNPQRRRVHLQQALLWLAQ
jgi:hypothetical protein